MRTYSKVIDREESVNGRRGQRPYRRDQIYQWLYDNSDSRGIVIYNQRQVAELLDIGYQNICQIYNDFIEVGYIIKHNKKCFEIVHDPDDLDWSMDFQDELSRIRKVHQKYTNYQKGE